MMETGDLQLVIQIVIVQNKFFQDFKASYSFQGPLKRVKGNFVFTDLIN